MILGTYNNNIRSSGSTRKLLGLTFQGETRDADGQIWGDVEIKGLTTDVCQASLHIFVVGLILVLGRPIQYWHVWGQPGHFT